MLFAFDVAVVVLEDEEGEADDEDEEEEEEEEDDEEEDEEDEAISDKAGMPEPASALRAGEIRGESADSEMACKCWNSLI